MRNEKIKVIICQITIQHLWPDIFSIKWNYFSKKSYLMVNWAYQNIMYEIYKEYMSMYRISRKG